MIRFWNAFTKITAWPVQFFCFRTKVHYEDRSVQGRHIKGPAIIISNHTSVFDYAVYIFVFITRSVFQLLIIGRYQSMHKLLCRSLHSWEVVI